jgi:hypothetical protein
MLLKKSASAIAATYPGDSPTTRATAMMRQQGGSQDRLFYSFKLEDHVPQDPLLRGIDALS